MWQRILAAIGLVLVSAGIGWFAVFTAQGASAVSGGQPPVTSVPGAYFNQGDLINLCVNNTTEAVRVEMHTSVLGNCVPGETQLTVEAMPSPPVAYVAPPPLPQP